MEEIDKIIGSLGNAAQAVAGGIKGFQNSESIGEVANKKAETLPVERYLLYAGGAVVALVAVVLLLKKL
jgi:hypothetical protein